MEKEKQLELEQRIAQEYDNMAGIVLMKDNNMVYEKYFNGCDENSFIHVYSVSKSVLSILFGIAIDLKLIQSVDQLVLEFFPNYKVKKHEHTLQNITIKDVLSMSAPYSYKDNPLTYIRYFMSKDWAKFALDRLGGNGTIGEFRYTPLIGPDILSAILVQATGQSVLAFAKQYLFDPLGIIVEKSIILKNAKGQMEFNKATNISGWVEDSCGLQSGGWGLTLRLKDMAKIAQLFLQGGVWNQHQVVSSSWIKECTKEHNRYQEMNLAYGYLWWILDDQSYAAMGDGGNIIYYNTKKNLIVCSSSLFVKDAKDRIALIKDFIEPILED